LEVSLKYTLFFNLVEKYWGSLALRFSKIQGNASFETPVKLNQSLEHSTTDHLRSLMKESSYQKGSLGLVETHRANMHLSTSDKQIFDKNIWARLRFVKPLREKLHSMDGIKEEIPRPIRDHLKDYLLQEAVLDSQRTIKYGFYDNYENYENYDDLWGD